MVTTQVEERLRGLPAIMAIFKRIMPTSGAAHEIAPVDGLRALAILLVIWCHLSAFGFFYGLNVGPAAIRYLADFGFSGVFLFFILSGFLLFLPYARALLDNRPWPSARKFYLRRALRILPLYYAAFVVLLLLQAGSWLHPQNAVPLSLIALLLHDMRSDAFTIMSALDGPFWTLTIEWQFYLLLPWLALALAKVAGRRTQRGFFFRLGGGLGALVVLGLAIRWLAATMYYDWTLDQPINAPGIPGFAMKLVYGVKGKYLEVFALGMAASILYVLAVERGGLAHQRRKILGSLAGITAVAGLLGCLLWAAQAQRIPFVPSRTVGVFVPPAGRLWEILGEWSLGLCFAFLLMGVLLGAPTLQRLFALAPLRFIGIISYSLYVWHYPILSFLSSTILAVSPISYLRFIALAAVLVLPLCSGSYYLIERPFIRLRRAARSPAEREVAPAA